MSKIALLLALLIAMSLFANHVHAEDTSAKAEPPLVWFNRYVTHWGELSPELTEYAIRVKPQIIQAGFWGPEYYSAISLAKDKGVDEVSSGIGSGHVDRQRRIDLINKLHEHDIKVVGMFSLSQFFGDIDKNAGFFGYVDRHWDEATLGPRVLNDNGQPVKGVDVLQRNAKGYFKQNWYNVEGGSEYRGTPADPHYREMLKRFVKAGIDAGLDGYTIVWPHQEDDTNPATQRAFKRWLGERYTAAQLREQFGIENLDTHTFESITGWYEPEDASPMKLEMLKFTQWLLHDTVREVFHEYGRSLKPDLIVGQWNHNYRSSMAGPGQLKGMFAQLNADERCVIPTEDWGKGDNFTWYSIGAWHMYWKPNAAEPEKEELAQFSLVHKYLREAGHGKPQAVKSDDGVNVAVYMAESVAHGGFTYPRGPKFDDPATEATVKQYFDFLRKHEDLYRDIESAARVALVYPRSHVHKGDTRAIDDFKSLGTYLTRKHVNFDVVVDEQLTAERRATYALVIEPQSEAYTAFDSEPVKQAMRYRLLPDGPHDVVAVMWKQPEKRRVMLHLVNHTYHVPADKLGRPADFQHPTHFIARIDTPTSGLRQDDGEARPVKFTLLRPDAEPIILQPQMEKNGSYTVNVGPMSTYGVVVAEW
jgi:hypothetical protein